MDREQHIERILSFIASEVSEKSLQITMDTPVEAIKMDSIDVIHVIFKAEEEFDVEIDISQQTKFETVGDFVQELLKFIEKRKVSSTVSVARTDRPAVAARRAKAVNVAERPEAPLAKTIGRSSGAPALGLAGKAKAKSGASAPAGKLASGLSEKTSKTVSKAPSKRTSRKPVIVAANEVSKESATQPKKIAVKKAARKASGKAAKQTGTKHTSQASKTPGKKSTGRTL